MFYLFQYMLRTSPSSFYIMDVTVERYASYWGGGNSNMWIISLKEHTTPRSKNNYVLDWAVKKDKLPIFVNFFNDIFIQCVSSEKD